MTITDLDFIGITDSQVIIALDKHLIVVIMSLCMSYFALFVFNKMLNF